MATCAVEGCGGRPWRDGPRCYFHRGRNTCRIEDCGKPVVGHELCQRHYYRWRSNGDPLVVQRDRNQPVECIVDGCTTKPLAHGYCNRHLLRVKNHGTPDGGRSAEGLLIWDHPGPSVVHRRPSYWSVHDLLSAVRGSARQYRCHLCSYAADEWAYDRGDPEELVDPKTGYHLSADLAHYFPLCRSCHRRLDTGDLRPGLG